MGKTNNYTNKVLKTSELNLIETTPNTIRTIEFGECFLDDFGYYKTFNNYTALHREVYEKYHGRIPEGYVIHHLDGNKTNNTPENLIALTKNDHTRLHQKGKRKTDSHKRSLSFNSSTTCFRNVCIQKDKRIAQGYFWCYQWYEGDKHRRCSSVTIDGLEAKVRRLNEELPYNLPWEDFLA